MVFGASVEPGILYENRFYHRDLGVDNRPDRLTAVAPGRVATLQLTTQPREGNIDAATWLRSEMQTWRGSGYCTWPTPSVQRPRPWSRPVSACAGPYRRPGSPWALLSFYGVPAEKGELAGFDSAFLAAIRSLHTLRESERPLVEPRRIELKRVRYGENLEQRARSATLEHHGEEQLRLLNDYDPQGEPPAGTLLKTVK